MGFTAALAAGGAAIQGASSIFAGREQARQAKTQAAWQAQELKIQSEENKIAAAQDEAARRRELTYSLQTIEAIRAGRGTGSGSPTAATIQDDVTETASRDMRSSRLNFLRAADQSSRQAAFSLSEGNRAARSAQIGGLLGAVSAGINAGTKFRSSMFTPAKDK